VAAGTTCTSSSKPVSPAWAYPSVLAAPAGGHPAGDPEWDYPSGKDHWCQTANGYEFNLQITPPIASNPVLTIVATGRKTGATNTNDYRVVQNVLSPNSITRYYRIVDGDIGFGSTTTTQGMVWSNGNISHAGIAQADLWATGSITGGYTLQNGAVAHPNQSTPINFSAFLASLSDIARAAQVNSPSTYFDDPTRDAWKLVFSSAGTYTAQACDMNSGNPVAKVLPTTNCGTLQTLTVPSNGAIYSPKSIPNEKKLAVGSGPYTITKYEPGQLLSLRRNPSRFNRTGRRTPRCRRRPGLAPPVFPPSSASGTPR